MVSGEVMISITEDLSSAEAGDEVSGGYYAGVITYSDASEYHIVIADEAYRPQGTFWGDYVSVAGLGEVGSDNTLDMISVANSEAAQYCDGLTVSGVDDFFLPSEAEFLHIVSVLGPSNTDDEKFQSGGSQELVNTRYYWASNEESTNSGVIISGGGFVNDTAKQSTTRYILPTRRVPV